jgi:FdhD protein
MVEGHQAAHFTRYSAGETEPRSSEIAIEVDVTLSVNGEAWLGYRCSPENLEAMAVGYLYNESFIQSAQEVASVRVCDEGDHIDLWLDHDVKKPTTWSKTSGCQGGVTQTIPEAILPVNNPVRYPIAQILAAIDRFLTELAKPAFPQHGVHTSMLLDKDQVICVINDIGRHNTLDKIAGECLLQHITLAEPVLITTGRLSSEMVYKTARMAIPLAISLHSTSDMAIKAADALGVTLVGHARRSQIDIYTHPERVIVA